MSPWKSDFIFGVNLKKKSTVLKLFKLKKYNVNHINKKHMNKLKN